MRDLPQIIDYDKDQLSYALANAMKERDEAREVLERIVKLSIHARCVEEDYAEWEKAVFAILDNCKKKEREMSERPTPETDAVAEKNIYGVACKVDVDFARRLERERDEAREALASREVVIAQQNVITDLLLERDEAREEIKRLKVILDLIKKDLS